MSDSGFSDVQGVPAESESSPEMTAGTMIRIAREAAGLHVAALAVSMKIPVKKLEALEADRLDLLHDAVFVRALAASVCRALKTDPAPVLAKLPLNKAPQLNGDERGINAPFQSQGGGAGMSLKVVLTNPYALLFVGLIVAGLVIKFVPGIRLPEWSTEDTAQATKASDTPDQAQVEHAAPDVVVASTETNLATTTVPSSTTPAAQAVAPAVPAPVEPPHVDVPAPKPAPTAAASVSAPSAPVVSKPAASTPAAMAANAKEPVNAASKPSAVASRPANVASAAASQPGAGASRPAVAASKPASAPALPSTGLVVFRPKGPTWVKVTDAKGIVQLSKMLAGGEVVGVSGNAPLAVVIGRADTTEVEVRGKAFPLTTTSKDNVARFEVK